MRLGTLPTWTEPRTPGRCHARSCGFSLHAALIVPAGQRDRLERLCRYVLRPPVAVERLHVTHDGGVRVSLREPWRDGTTDFVFDPVDFLGRLAGLVPRPRITLILLRDPRGACRPPSRGSPSRQRGDVSGRARPYRRRRRGGDRS